MGILTKKRYLLPIISIVFLSAKYAPNRVEVEPDTRRLSQIKGFEDRLIEAESQGNPKAFSIAYARGLYQITKVVIDWYNRENGTNHSKKSVYNPEVARTIWVWYIDKLELMHKDDRYKIVSVTNSYNMGPTNTKRGRFNHSYLQKICPSSWAAFREGKSVRYYKGKYGVVAVVR
jgi:hypothetical protein